MAKGDVVTITIAVGGTVSKEFVEATKAGRTVRVKAGTRWTEVEEMTRPTSVNRAGLPAGTRLKIATAAIISLKETRDA